MDRPVANTEHGKVRGISVTPEVSGFFGIPYASPPIGDLRWKPPGKSSAWLGVRDAATFGPDAIQPAGTRVSRAPGMSEDCLYMNVWAPKARRQNGWPVMVWACGGAFTTGGGAFAEEDPAKLAARGAVVVSFNIRLNIFGFIAHPALSAESPHGSSGNYGLLDQAAALRWVRENIKGFNGDSSRVTFFGQSAGATLGMLLLSSPLEQHPYDRAIFQSPGSFSKLLPLVAAERHGAPLGSDVDEMRALSTEEVLAKAKQLPTALPSLWLPRPLRPIADGWVLTAEEPMAVGNFQPVPVIIGTNEDEGNFFGPRMGIKTPEEFEKFARNIFGHNTDEALMRYPVSGVEDVPAMFSALYADRGFNLPIARLVQDFARSGAEVYRYVYSYPGMGKDAPPTHADEARVLMDAIPDRPDRSPEMSELMARYWLSFAATGTPNEQDLPHWGVYTERAEEYLKLDLPSSSGRGWRTDLIEFVERAKVD